MITLAIAVPALILVLAVDREPSNLADGQADGDMAGIRQLLIDNDPRLLLGDERTLHLTEEEVNALLAWTIGNVSQLREVSGQVSLRPGVASLGVSHPATPFGGYLNLELSVLQDGSELRLDSLGVGAIRIPGDLIGPLLELSRPYLEEDENFRLLSSLIGTVEILTVNEGSVDLKVDWQEDRLAELHQQARRRYLDEEGRQRLLHYYGLIDRIAASFPEDQRRASLLDFLRPLFASAREKSAAGVNPKSENRALFIALSVYLTELEIDHLLGPPGAVPYPAPRMLSVRVGPREDLAQHIVGSAAISAAAGAPLADLISYYKEAHDSRYGTGFSFSDLTANRVGASLGSLATLDDEHARGLQDYMSEAAADSDYMPEVKRFDGLSEQEFRELYGDRNTPPYRERFDEIEQAIASRPLFQTLGMP